MCDGKEFTLNIHDTAGPEEFDRLRPLAYPETDVFIICFSIINPHVLDNVHSKWYPEVRKHCPKTPILLVGTYLDLREDKTKIEQLKKCGQVPVQQAEGESLGKKIDAYKYLECSAISPPEISTIFDEAIRCAMSAKIKIGKKSMITSFFNKFVK